MRVFLIVYVCSFSGGLFLLGLFIEFLCMGCFFLLSFVMWVECVVWLFFLHWDCFSVSVYSGVFSVF